MTFAVNATRTTFSPAPRRWATTSQLPSFIVEASSEREALRKANDIVRSADPDTATALSLVEI